jgi:hypothetical protein
MTGVAPEAMLVGDTNVIPDPHPLEPGDRDPSLRSARAVIGYSLRDSDKTPLGEVVDLAFDLDKPKWQLTHFVMDIETSSGDRRVLVPEDLVEIGMPDEKAAYTRLSREELEQAPTFPTEGLQDDRFLDSVSQYYGRRDEHKR